MPTYAKAPKLAETIRDALVKRHYPSLVEHEVTIGLLFAHATTNDAGEKTGPAIKHQGYPAAGLIEVTPLKKRVAGLPDCIITIDGDQWPDWSDQQRHALIDHELAHIELLFDPESGDIKADDHGRPRMKCRLHDYQLGGFEVIAKRYERSSFEVAQAEQLRTEYGQCLFAWAKEADEDAALVKGVEKELSRKMTGAEKASVGIGAKRGRKPKPAPQPSA